MSNGTEEEPEAKIPKLEGMVFLVIFKQFILILFWIKGTEISEIPFYRQMFMSLYLYIGIFYYGLILNNKTFHIIAKIKE